MVILFDKNTYIHYGCDTPDYNDDWIHFQISAEEENLLSDLSIPLNQPIYHSDVHTLSQYVGMLTDNFHAHIYYKDELLNSLMHSILYKLVSEIHKSISSNYSHKYYSTLFKLRTNLYNNPSQDWSAVNISNKIDLSISHFQHLYKQFFGISFQQDIICARVEYAKFYLKSSNMSIRDLAEFCGYGNELHFMRQFKKWEGITPSHYRKNLRDMLQ